MLNGFHERLRSLKGRSIRIIDNDDYPDASVIIDFEDVARLQVDYWRLLKNGKPLVSSFDHKERYGLPAPIDAIQSLRNEVKDERVIEGTLDAETGDLLFLFTGGIKLQVFNFTGYEVWECSFPDGTRELSNHCLN